ncbi:bifunctional 2-C-methyl-D-erythritol 4-phosphate cytidylyltransferase/2-C-methyl-D-erythritol 2,4-cyclodiphosphate synthase [Qingshengfaniella alkalisoli]|uniref:Bifunctional enzyme IspD/IspF n=1 Tax=Qingshengfaniella alkalisoli TaxID=2599296 RepID=A0A5B8IVY8_9RHOB|nr:bifunctional 2-C-methyl-D-erythritol 4-phosphate cytidylyltransferase/2-C-methyl-D-erythritol 2,4-cyclodiphosphate synthase [Qingshengfaniella alkalisoli]QDY69041.1 bifunctional 2-C-methyl-D-erythritol 4-phosphate cytidylyltransferase/2-C-methyl-D-erythritol 2,4-cyclodiphosphate synthase [Qingshengfaniella alkalisoli]
MSITAVVVAAGRGVRAGGDLPKQFQTIGPFCVLELSIRAFTSHPQIDSVVLVVNPTDRQLLDEHLSDEILRNVTVVDGGQTRRASVQSGLAMLPDVSGKVLIHDGARPMVTAGIIDRVIDALNDTPGAAPALPVSDALWRGRLGRVLGTQDRDGLFRAQTPQGFHTAQIIAAHAQYDGPDAADDVEIARAAGLDVRIVQGDETNIKVTYPADFARCAALLKQQEIRQLDIRLGNGFDVHRFCDGDHVTLCGVAVPHDKGLDGHSDADVGMHAVTDAIYGALADGDIGQHFPPTDPQWKGAASQIFLEHAVKLAGDRGYRIGNIDCTLICERPKIGPVAASMREALARIMGVEVDRVSVKATTSERLGFTGREEGIAALASATLVSE